MEKIGERLERNAESVAGFTEVQSEQLMELQKQTRALEDIARANQPQPYKPPAPH
jgi:hypothetical protein